MYTQDKSKQNEQQHNKYKQNTYKQDKYKKYKYTIQIQTGPTQIIQNKAIQKQTFLYKLEVFMVCVFPFVQMIQEFKLLKCD